MDVSVGVGDENDVSSPLAYGLGTPSSKIGTPASHTRGTPLRSRPDISNTPNVRQVNLAPPSDTAVCVNDLRYVLAL